MANKAKEPELDIEEDFDIEGESEPSVLQKAGNVGLGALQAASKIRSSAYNVTSGALFNKILAAAAKDKSKAKDIYPGFIETVKKALNPTSVDQPPSLAEAAELAGVKEGGKVSDVLGGFEDVTPGSEADRWYVPNVGGPLDFTIRGTGATVTQELADPLNWLSGFLASGQQTGLRAAAKAAVEAPTRAGASVGRKIFRAGVRPVLEAGKKLSKDEEAMVDLMLREGVTSSRNRVLSQQADDALKRIGSKGGQILNDAGTYLPAGKGVQIPQREINQHAYDVVKKYKDAGRIKGATRREVGAESRAIYNDMASPGSRPPSAKVDPQTVTTWKTDEQSAFGPTHYDKHAPAPKSRARVEMDDEFENRMRGTIEKYVPEIKANNADYGNMKAIAKKADQAKHRSALPMSLGLPDLMTALGSYGVGGPMTTVEAMLALQAGKLALGTPGGRRFMGSTLWNLQNKSPIKKRIANTAAWSLLRKPNPGLQDPLADELDLGEE